jgi:hypothetical protein
MLWGFWYITYGAMSENFRVLNESLEVSHSENIMNKSYIYCFHAHGGFGYAEKFEIVSAADLYRLMVVKCSPWNESE